MNRPNRIVAVLLSVLFLAGCSHESGLSGSPKASTERHLADSAGTGLSKPIAGANEAGMGGMGTGMGIGPAMRMAKPKGETITEEPKDFTDFALNKRRVIFDSNIELRVDEFDGVESRVSMLIEQHGGFISEANVSHHASQSRTGHWTIRVPVAAYRQMLDSVGSLGELESRKENAEDVTVEFYDIEARIKNKQRLEDRIAKLLDNANSELRKMIEVENELARVREEIERMQGRLRLLTDVTGMSTIHLAIVEREKEPASQVAATFSDRVANAWNSAVTQATNVTQNATVVLVRNVFHIAFSFLAMILTLVLARVVILRMAKTGGESTSPARS